MSYTYKHLILSTWKLLQPDYEEEDSDNDSIPDITEVHYYPGDSSDDDDDEHLEKHKFFSKATSLEIQSISDDDQLIPIPIKKLVIKDT
jgi:hypothetical protein